MYNIIITALTATIMHNTKYVHGDCNKERKHKFNTIMITMVYDALAYHHHRQWSLSEELCLELHYP